VNPSEAISPTAHYTGYVWAHNNLSHSALVTREGRVLFESFRPIQIAAGLAGAPSLETYLLARHHAIDTRVHAAIDEHGVTQVIEVACGLSPRGWRFSDRYGKAITYIEADLPAMAQRKRAALARMGSLGEHHRVVALDALLDDGPLSLAAVAAELNADEGLAIITEGLLGYLPTDTVNRIWRRFAAVLSGFSNGRYISDLHIGGAQSVHVRWFRVLLSMFVRSRVSLHYGSSADATASLHAAGFRSAHIHDASELAPTIQGAGSELVHIIEASTR